MPSDRTNRLLELESPEINPTETTLNPVGLESLIQEPFNLISGLVESVTHTRDLNGFLSTRVRLRIIGDSPEVFWEGRVLLLGSPGVSQAPMPGHAVIMAIKDSLDGSIIVAHYPISVYPYQMHVEAEAFSGDTPGRLVEEPLLEETDL